MPSILTEHSHEPAASAPRASRIAGLVLLSALLMMAALGPVVSGHDAISQQLDQVRQAPSATHWLGTDHLGRDQFTRVAMALRVSLVGGLLTVLVAAALGAGLGLLAAWRQGWTERMAVVLADCAMALPGLLLVLLIAAIAPGSFSALYLGLAATLWVEHFRLVRVMSRRVLASPAVEAARLLGFGPRYIIRTHLLPALLPMLTTVVCFGVANAVLALAALGLVGVGLQPPTAELGVMLIDLMPYYREAPWLIASPMACLVLLLAGLVLLAGNKVAP
ncbi:MAG: ABC transporter permease [Burkholderiales bacterium PBB6]|nr:MAG: ABC transporter permease [Burkholderiales bacterium PBB6]